MLKNTTPTIVNAKVLSGEKELKKRKEAKNVWTIQAKRPNMWDERRERQRNGI
ncbi:MAG: hypothetical protein Q7K42_04585 [Candidatus Diapherotrites archaeon]|nr:hypothetical protein [Candidatus Diapherotrites archaeon]